MNRATIFILAGLLAACSDSPKPASVDAATGTDSNDDVANGSDVATTDGAADTTTTLGSPGAACDTDEDCAGPNPTCLGLPSGYCAPDCSAVTCPSGSVCFEFEDGAMGCLDGCAGDADCRRSEGYICDTDSTCWWYEPTGSGDSAIGGPCKSDADCKDAGASCYEEGFDGNANGFVAGYCLIFDCTANSCPAGARCVDVTANGDSACFAACGESTPCPRTEGYFCAADDLACWPGCDTDADCPAGYGCSDDIGSCVFGLTSDPFVCADQRFEPNETLATAKDISVPTTVTGLDLCAADEDWYRVAAPAKTLVTVGIEFNHVVGDLDLLAYDDAGVFLGSRMGPENYPAARREYENGLEYQAVINMEGDVAARFRVKPFGDAKNHYDLKVMSVPWLDGLLCGTPFTEAECRGVDTAGTKYLYQFPYARADDLYVPDGYRLESSSSYRWARRELIMLIRHAIHVVQETFPGTTPLGLLDMSDKAGITPGFDVGAARHPELTHDGGGNIDVAYYQNDGSNLEVSVCGSRDSANQDGSYCTSTNGHIMDVPRTTRFLATLMLHPRLRVVGVDTMLYPLIMAEVERLNMAGEITADQYTRLRAKIAYGEGWPYHFAHIHISMQ